MRYNNHIETRRNIWQNAFWGVYGTLDWEVEQLNNHPNSSTNDWSIYQRVGEFFEGVDLDGGNWHAGMTRLRSNGNLKYEKSYRDDCIRDDELADVVYLRSGDRERAFGVITNRRANYYTLGKEECTDNSGDITAPVHSDSIPQYNFALQNYGSVSPGNFNNRLRIRNMRLAKEYKIKYYSPYDQVNSIKEETRWGPQLTLEFPDMDTLDIILFEVFRMGEDFKSKNMQSDTTDSDITLTREPKKKVTNDVDNVRVFPNPNDGNFVIVIDKSTNAKAIHISDNLGKRINTRHEIFKENHYNKTSFNSGIYFIEVVFEDKIIIEKVVIN